MSWLLARTMPFAESVPATHGVVISSGTMSSWTKRLAAEQAAHRVDSVRDRRERAQAARQSLSWNASVPHDKIGSAARAGVVSREGTVTVAPFSL
jgi:hypothetical protein